MWLKFFKTLEFRHSAGGIFLANTGVPATEINIQINNVQYTMNQFPFDRPQKVSHKGKTYIFKEVMYFIKFNGISVGQCHGSKLIPYQDNLVSTGINLFQKNFNELETNLIEL